MNALKSLKRILLLPLDMVILVFVLLGMIVSNLDDICMHIVMWMMDCKKGILGELKEEKEEEA